MKKSTTLERMRRKYTQVILNHLFQSVRSPAPTTTSNTLYQVKYHYLLQPNHNLIVRQKGIEYCICVRICDI
uniref:Uncharacterized protein n=1 Tax=Anguilla anguilla TaxID=7936 RepID=A0A0E9WH04_ANGAN